MKILMRSILSLAIMLFLLPQDVSAQTISEGQAMQNVRNFLNISSRMQMKSSAKNIKANASSALSLAYQAKSGENTAFYVFNIGEDDGFVIAGGDEVAKEILAYVPHGHFDYETIPDNVKWWLGEYEKAITYAKTHGEQSSQTAPKHAPQSEESQSYREIFTDIPNMITTQWGQGEYYNNAIPLMGNEHPLTGCVATALAQILKYWNFPSKGSGSIVNDIYSVNFAEATYDWGNMLDSYNSESSTTEIDAVSQLMYHIGASLGSSYRFDTYETAYAGREGYNYKSFIQKALENYFGYSGNIQNLLRDGVCDDDWECIIYSELSAGRPVFYAGTSQIGGHAFVCQGYSADLDLFAFNWGWNGSADGYYSLSSTNGLNGFTMGQWILTGFEPAGRQHQNNVEYGDRFADNGLYYTIHNPILKRAAFAPVLDGEYSGDIVVPSNVIFNGENYNVTHIGQFALSNLVDEDNPEYNFNLSSVSLPNSIKSFGASGISNAYYVKEFSFPANLQKIGTNCFGSCASLEMLSIPEGVTVINENCFNGCQSLKSIDLHDNIKSIGSGSFANCKSLKELTIPNGITFLDRIIYGSNSLLKITLPETIETINAIALSECANLSYLYCHSVDVPHVFSNSFPESIKQGVLFVPQSAIEAYSAANFWKDWGSIEAIETATETKYLGESFEIDGIRYSVIANGVTVEKCITRQQEVVIPQNAEYKGEQYAVLQIGTYAFLNFDENDILESVVLPEGLKVIGDGAFSNCFHLKNINLPESLIAIENAAFATCRELDNVFIPSSIKTISSNTFDNCLSLKNIKIGENVQLIEPYAFYGCKSLESIVIPYSVILLYGESFGNCPNLTKMYSFSPKIYCWQEWMDVFQPDAWVYDTGTPIASNQANAILYVQKEYLSNYQGYSYKGISIWQDWGNIVEMPDAVQLTDGERYAASEDRFSVDVNYTRTFDNTEWQPLYVPFNMSYDEWADKADVAEVHNVRGYDNNGDGEIDEIVIEFNKLTSGEITPNVPYVIKAKNTGEVTFECTGKNLLAAPAEEGTVECSSTKMTYSFHGVYLPKTDMFTSGAYHLSGGAFHQATTDDAVLPPNRFYLMVTPKTGGYNPVSAPQMIRMKVNGDDTTTSIEGIEVDIVDDGIYYDLMGRRIINPTKGIYIQNGKKVFVK